MPGCPGARDEGLGAGGAAGAGGEGAGEAQALPRQPHHVLHLAHHLAPLIAADVKDQGL